MYLNRNIANKHQQRGGALAIAIFVIVVMSLLTVAISRNISASTDQTIQEVLGTRALLMAESANEAALLDVFRLQTDANSPVNSCANITGRNTVRYFAGAGFDGCAVLTRCSSTSIGSEQYFLVSSRATCKSALAGNSVNPNGADRECRNTDLVCASREVQVEAKSL